MLSISASAKASASTSEPENDAMTYEDKTAGVYHMDDSSAPALVHQYDDGDYLLQDIAELFALGELGQDGTLMLSPRELKSLKARADAESFDHEEGFIQMCLDIWRFGTDKDGPCLRFISVE